MFRQSNIGYPAHHAPKLTINPERSRLEQPVCDSEMDFQELRKLKVRRWFATQSLR